METIRVCKSLKRKSCDDVFGSEEGVHSFLFRVYGISGRVLVNDCDVLEYEGSEWFEMYLLECDISVKRLGKRICYPLDYECLYLRKLYGKSSCKYDGSYNKDDAP